MPVTTPFLTDKETVEKEKEQRELRYQFYKNEMDKVKRGLVPDKGVNDVPLVVASDHNVLDFIESFNSVPGMRKERPIRYIDRYYLKNGEDIETTKKTEIYPHRKIISKYHLRIGDCCFHIPPESIHFKETSRTYREPSIRSTSTVKKKYGFSNTDLMFDLYFNGYEQINGFEVESPFEGTKYFVDGLRPFLAQCKVSPIMPVENEFLNKICGLYCIAIQSIMISTVPGFPNLLKASVIAIECDHSVYTSAPKYEFSNLIDWDLYKFNYQRLLTKIDFGDAKTSKINEQYKLNRVNNFTTKAVSLQIPDENDLFKETEEGTIIDLTKLKYNTIISNETDKETKEPIDNFVVTQLNFGFENLILNAQLSNSSIPAIQYLGSGDSVISMQIITTDSNVASKFKSLISDTQYIIKKLKDCSGIGFVKVENELLSLLGSNYLLIDNVSVETVPNFPGNYLINLECVNHDVISYMGEELNGIRPFIDNRDGTGDDCIGQNVEGLVRKITQDVYAEYKLTETNLYPDLFVPTYDELDFAIEKINTYRENKGITKLPFDVFPKKVSRTTLLGQPFVGSLYVDPDFYFMYPQANLKNIEIKPSELVATNSVVPAAIEHTYINKGEANTNTGDAPASGENNTSGYEFKAEGATSCEALGIKATGVVKAFLDALFEKVGCGYVYGTEGQFFAKKGDPRYNAETDKYIRRFGSVNEEWIGREVYDCSGFVAYGFWKIGHHVRDKPLRTTHHGIYTADCMPISKSDLQPGDMLLKDGHIAVYIGNGQTVEAANKKRGVCIGKMSWNNYTYFGRVKWREEVKKKYENGGSSTSNSNARTTPNNNSNNSNNSNTTNNSSNARSNNVQIGKIGGDKDQFDDIILAKSQKYGLDPNWVKALIWQESHFNPRCRSSVGAIGLMQVMASSAKECGESFTEAKFYDPAINIEVGTHYLKNRLDEFGDYQEAVGSYNCGPGAWRRIKSGKIKIYKETKTHIEKVTGYYYKLTGELGGSGQFSGDGSNNNSNNNNSTSKPGLFEKTVIKKHGEKVVDLYGYFGYPFIGPSPVNPLINITNPKNSGIDYLKGFVEGIKSKIPVLKDNELYNETIERININKEYLFEDISKSYGTWANESDYRKLVAKFTDEKNNNFLLGMTIDETKYSCRGSMLRAFPTYFMSIGQDSTTWFDGRRFWTNYYPYKSIVNISIAHDYDQPVGTAYIKATNLSNNLNKRPSFKFDGGIADDPDLILKKWTYKHCGFILGTPIITEKMIEARNDLVKDMKLQAGSRIHIRMGYGNDITSLNVMFNGVVAEITHGEIVEIVAQSDGAELINNVVSGKEGKTNGLGKLQKETSNMITSLLIDRSSWTNLFSSEWGEANEYNIENFGTFTGKNLATIFNNREFEYDLCKNVYLGVFERKLFCQMPPLDPMDGEENMEMFLYNRTPWDVGAVCANVLPEFVTYPVYHQFESRLFYGLPYWFYKYRYDIDIDGIILEEAKTFSQLHLATSTDIIDNRIKATSKFLHTNAICTYTLGSSVESTPTMFADRTIDWSKQKTKIIDTAVQQDYFGVDKFYEILGFQQGVENAESIAVSSLVDSFSKMYYDEIILLGNPGIKPYDQIFIDDAYGEMYGLARVNNVVHSFGGDTGFTTSVTPGLLAYSKTEDSGSANIYRSIVHLMDMATALYSGRNKVIDMLNNYSPIMYDYIYESGSEELIDFMYEALSTLAPLKDNDEWHEELNKRNDKIMNEEKRKLFNKLDTNLLLTTPKDVGPSEMSKYVARLPLLRPVTGYFIHGNCIGIRPLLHKGGPFVTGIKGSSKLMEGYKGDSFIDELNS